MTDEKRWMTKWTLMGRPGTLPAVMLVEIPQDAFDAVENGKGQAAVRGAANVEFVDTSGHFRIGWRRDVGKFTTWIPKFRWPHRFRDDSWAAANRDREHQFCDDLVQARGIVRSAVRECYGVWL